MIQTQPRTFALTGVSVGSCWPCRSILSAMSTWLREQAQATFGDDGFENYCPEEDLYDPRSPECVSPATVDDISKHYKELLDAQITRLEAFAALRPFLASHITEHYLRLASELRAEAAVGLTSCCSATNRSSLDTFCVSSCSTRDTSQEASPTRSSCSTCDTSQATSPTRSHGTSQSLGDDESAASAEENAKLEEVITVPALVRSKSEPMCFKPSRFSLLSVVEEEDSPRLRRGLPAQRFSIQAPRCPAVQDDRSLRIRHSLLDNRPDRFVEGCALWLLEHTFLGKALGAVSGAR